MNYTLLKKNYFFDYLNNLNSESLGYYFSLLLHFCLLIFAIGLPNFFPPKQISVPNIIPIEIVNVMDITSIPKKIENLEPVKNKKNNVEEKKFNSSNKQEIEKIQIKEKTKIDMKEIEVVKNIEKKIIEKKDKPIILEEKKIIESEEKFESLPTKKIKPKLKPKPQSKILQPVEKPDLEIKAQPKIKPEPDFSIASMLKDLRNEESTKALKKEEKEKEPIKNEIEEQNKKDEVNMRLSISEIDLLRQQLSFCWIAPAGAVIEKGMAVKISAKLQTNRRIYDNSVRIIDTNISKSNPFYGPITESAMRTLLNPDCIPLKLPEDKYELWKNLTITFDYSIMKGYE